MSTPATPDLAEQLPDGCACPTKDCAGCALRMAAERHSFGRFRLNICRIRSVSGTSCAEGGIPYDDGVAAVRDLTNGAVVLTIYTKRTRHQVRDILVQGRGAIVSVRYDRIAKSHYSCCNSFTGTNSNHAMYANRYRVIADAPDLIQTGDPLADGRRDYLHPTSHYREGYGELPADLLLRAAEERHGGSVGSASITIVTGRDTEGITRTARDSGQLRASASVGSADIGNIAKGTSYDILSTVNGGSWLRDTDGGKSTIWCRVKTPTGKVGYGRGELFG